LVGFFFFFFFAFTSELMGYLCVGLRITQIPVQRHIGH